MRTGVFNVVIFLTAITALTTLFADDRPLIPEQKKTPGKVVFEEPTLEELRAISEAFVGGKVPEISTNQENGALSFAQLWRGETPHLDSSLRQVTLRYGNYGAIKEDVAKDERSFFIFLTLSDEGFSLRSSRTGLISELSGIRLRWGERRIVPLSVSGSDHARMIVASLQATAEGIRSVALCPRELAPAPEVVEEKKSTDKDSSSEVSGEPKPPVSEEVVARGFEKSSFAIGALRSKITADVAGRVLSGLKPGIAIAQILTTNDIPRSIEYIDRVFTVDPKVALEYLPFRKEDDDEKKGLDEQEDLAKTLPLGSQPITHYTSGVRVRIDLKNAAGYFQNEQLSQTATIYETSFSKAAPLFVSKYYQPLTGSCTLIHFRRVRVKEYGKGQPVVSADWME